MENVGCVTLRDEYLFRSKVTAASLDYRRDTILHELSHMWFGDLVTMRWWDDLWLKESFATWAANFAVSERADDPAAAWAVVLQQLQDARPTGRISCPRPTRSPPTSSTWRPSSRTSTRSPTPRARRCWSSWSPTSAGTPSCAGSAATSPSTRTATPSLADLLRSLRAGLRPRPVRAGRRSGWRPPASNTLRLALTVDDQGVITSAVVEQTAPGACPTLRAHRIAARPATPIGDDRLVRVGPVRDRRRRAAYAGARAGRPSADRRRSWSTTTT